MSEVRTRSYGSAAVITVSNPPHGYMTHELVGELLRAFRAAERDPLVRTVIFTGADAGVFIQHYELAELEALSRKLTRRGDRYTEHAHTPEREMDVLFRRIEDSAKPVIAAINGNAMGFGCELALACDFRIAESGNYLLGQPEILVGLVPGAGGTQRLARTVGAARALELVLFGRRLSPAEALAVGLVHEVSSGPVLDLTLEWAKRFDKLSPTAIAHGKRLIHQASETSLQEGLQKERALFVDTLATPEANERLYQAVREGRDFRTV
ncbi:enoyl-CoA hydratase/isomerase family protein [Pandoraea soli]|uniref:Enoyl-CoA hydratase n=1 Tax=Pandoraea soli TaxID=2508293 RepID=A0ABY6W529_9BURK|nr:enoyl-CoA hydratase/isomerase family protein [Pandoraea soli]VVE27093.1 enoyl-CoA hydratase [Pandoraea soli]